MPPQRAKPLPSYRTPNARSHANASDLNRSLVTFIDLSRWVAASLVVLGHARDILLGQLPADAIAPRALNFVCGLGHQAVVVFFVLSGFLVGGMTWARWNGSHPQVLEYSVTRFSRIYSVFLPALVVGFIIDSVGLHWFGASPVYAHPERAGMMSLSFSIAERLNLPVAIGNLFMLQGVTVPPFGSNGPLWSLANEWWYYTIFAVATVIINRPGIARVGAGAILALLLVVLPVELLLWGVIWCLGIFAHLWITEVRWKPHPVLAIAIFLVALVSVYRGVHWFGMPQLARPSRFLTDMLVAVAYVFLLVSCARVRMGIPLARFHAFMAEFSYSVYLYHFPLLVLMAAFLSERFALGPRMVPSSLRICLFFVVILVIYAYCLTLFSVTERHTPRLRRTLMEVAGRLRGPAQKRP